MISAAVLTACVSGNGTSTDTVATPFVLTRAPASPSPGVAAPTSTVLHATTTAPAGAPTTAVSAEPVNAPAASPAAPAVTVPAPRAVTGRILADQRFSYTGGAEFEAHRVQYTSTDDRGSIIGVTGVVLLPSGPPPNGGWPVLSWSHGTTGLGDSCAPSRTDDVRGQANLFTQLLRAGVAVAATDYAGLGTPGPHPYLDGASEGRAAIDMVRAARAVSNRTSTRWIAAGYSQGGQSALFAAELAATYGAGLQLIGAAALAPVSNLAKLVDLSPGIPFVPIIASGLVAQNGSVRLSDLLSPRAYAKSGVIESGCIGDIGTAYQGMTPDDLFGPGVRNSPVWNDFAAAGDPGHRRIGVPVLVAQGGDDRVVPKALTDALVGRMCGMGRNVLYKTFSKADHYSIQLMASTDLLSFASDRAAGRHGYTNC